MKESIFYKSSWLLQVAGCFVKQKTFNDSDSSNNFYSRHGKEMLEREVTENKCFKPAGIFLEKKLLRPLLTEVVSREPANLLKNKIPQQSSPKILRK